MWSGAMPDGAISQKTRLGKYHSPIGADALALLRFRGEEGINQLGQFRVEALSPSGGVDLDQVLGLHGTVEIASLQHGPRFYDGIITEAEVVDRRLDGWLYSLTMRPWLWLTSLRRNQRIFHNETAPDIITKVLKKYGFELRPDLVKTYDPIEYTVQYGESDLTFVSRMMERYGISYHFEHALKSHVMVLTDGMECFCPAPGGSREFQAVKGQHRWEYEHFNVWSLARKITTGRVKLTDYNFKTPTAAMPVDQTGGAHHAQGEIESFDYPGIYPAQAPGKAVVRMRADGERGPDGLFLAAGDTASLSPGMLVTLTSHPEAALNGKAYLLAHAEHKFDAEGYASGTTLTEGDSYHGSYRFHPEQKPFLPAMQTPLSHILGPQTAIVVGDGEIDCDEFGRILVRFHWDLKDAYSMRCRVAQVWAGPSWGGMVIPRIGMEVLVEFLEGDPDKPLVTGCVYNGKNMPYYPLPQHKTKSVFRTDTHQGEGSNELTFEDEHGREEIFIHAQKDMTTKVENHNTEQVVANKVTSVGGANLTEVHRSDTTTVGQNMTISVGTGPGGDVVRGALAKNHFGIKAAAYFIQSSLASMTGQGNYSLTATGSIFMTAAKAAAQTVAGANMVSVGLVHNLAVGGSIFESAGKDSSEVVMGTKTIDAHKAVLFRCGKSEIHMKPDGTITIKGTKLLIEEKDLIKGKATKIEWN
jgi:type VI secretion system secreted protein VgrG